MRHISILKWVLALVTVLTFSISACAPTPESTSSSIPTVVATPSPSVASANGFAGHRSVANAFFVAYP